MVEKRFFKFAATENNPHWNTLIMRQDELYSREDDVRTHFARDYTEYLSTHINKTLLNYNPDGCKTCITIIYSSVKKLRSFGQKFFHICWFMTSSFLVKVHQLT